MIVYAGTTVGADAHIGPCTFVPNSPQSGPIIQSSLRADVGIGPYDGCIRER